MALAMPLKTCLVTGASSGLGEALATRLARRGWTVWGTARDPARVRVAGVRAVALDLCDEDSFKAFVDKELPSMGGIGLLVNNAGAGVFGGFEGFDNEQIERQMKLLLFAPIMLTRAVLPSMLGQGHGCIVNVSSLSVRFPLPCMTVYNSAKAGLSGFSRSLGRELRGTGVRVIDFQPGDIRTEFNDRTERVGGDPAAWAALERNLRGAPRPDRVAASLVRAIEAGREGTVIAGSFFQTVLAPLGQTVLPGPLFRALERRYFAS